MVLRLLFSTVPPLCPMVLRFLFSTVPPLCPMVLRLLFSTVPPLCPMVLRLHPLCPFFRPLLLPLRSIIGKREHWGNDGMVGQRKRKYQE
jgi:hypothetical protein